MYRLIRNTHLILGLASVLFILTYAVSAVQMAHRVRLRPTVVEEDLSLAAGLAPRRLAEVLMEQRGYGGELGKPQTTPTGYRISITRPGANVDVRYDAATGQTHLRRETRSFLGMLNRLHHQNGLHHEDGRLNAWGWALALVSIALLAIGASGIYLWFRLRAERVLGFAVLTVHLVVSVALLAVLRL
jgi:hypothetical protein